MLHTGNISATQYSKQTKAGTCYSKKQHRTRFVGSYNCSLDKALARKQPKATEVKTILVARYGGCKEKKMYKNMGKVKPYQQFGVIA